MLLPTRNVYVQFYPQCTKLSNPIPYYNTRVHHCISGIWEVTVIVSFLIVTSKSWSTESTPHLRVTGTRKDLKRCSILSPDLESIWNLSKIDSQDREVGQRIHESCRPVREKRNLERWSWREKMGTSPRSRDRSKKYYFQVAPSDSGNRLVIIFWASQIHHKNYAHASLWTYGSANYSNIDQRGYFYTVHTPDKCTFASFIWWDRIAELHRDLGSPN